jgi:hypothetical protein
MVVKGEYLTLTSHKKKKDVYVYQYYKLGSIIHHFTDLIIGKNIKLHTLPHKSKSQVRYFLPYSKHEKWMDTINNRDDLDELMELLMYILDISYYDWCIC